MATSKGLGAVALLQRSAARVHALAPRYARFLPNEFASRLKSFRRGSRAPQRNGGPKQQGCSPRWWGRLSLPEPPVVSPITSYRPAGRTLRTAQRKRSEARTMALIFFRA